MFTFTNKRLLKPKFSVVALVIFCLLFVGVGTYLVFRTFAADGTTFAEEFSTSPLNLSRWSVRTPWNTQYTLNEAQWYDPANTTIANGNLNIRTEKRTTNGFNYASGIVTSLPTPKFSYGYYEMNAKLPKGKGIWPAFWLTNDSTLEIDVFEVLGHDPNTVHMTLHKNRSQVYTNTFTGPDFSAGYHTFAVDWQPTYVRWYIDGVKRAEYIAAIPPDSLYIVANTTVGTTSSWSGAPDATTVFPQYYNIDYIRRFDQKPTTTIVADTVPPTVSFAAPTNGATITGTANVTANAADNVSVSKVELYVDGALKGTKTAAPYTYPLDTTTLVAGNHTLLAKAYDSSSLTSDSQVSVIVSTGPLALPTIQILSPANGTVISNGKVGITVKVVDQVQVKSVAYYLDNVLMATQTYSPYSYYFSAKKASTGTHTIRAVLTDIQGRTASNQITISR